MPTIRALYKSQCEAMLAALEREFGHTGHGGGDVSLQWNRPVGGMFLWTRLPAGLDAVKLLPKAVDHNVAFVPGSAFYADNADPRSMRLSFVTATWTRSTPALRRWPGPSARRRRPSDHPHPGRPTFGFDAPTGRGVAERAAAVCAGALVSYLYRNVNTVVYPDLVRDIGLDANTLGLLTGVYFMAFAAAQLPVGMALDRFGPRCVQMPMLAVAALGGVLFAQAESLQGLLAARALIGLGVSASLMAAIKASSLWLPPERLPMSTAVLLAVGGLGAMASTAPMQLVTDAVGWRMAFWGIASGAAAVAMLIWARVPEHHSQQAAHASNHHATSLKPC